MNANAVQQLSSLLPSNIHEETADRLTPWSISKELFARLGKSGSVVTEPTLPYRKVVVLSTDPEWRFVWKYFSHDLSNRYMIQSIYCMHNRRLTTTFELQLINQDNEASSFPQNWDQEPNLELRTKVMTRWKEATKLFSPVVTVENDGRRYQWNSVKVLPLWHGTTEEICDAVCKSGFVFFGKKSREIFLITTVIYSKKLLKLNDALDES